MRRCVAAYSRNARLTVSFFVFVPDSRMASARASSSRSICVTAKTPPRHVGDIQREHISPTSRLGSAEGEGVAGAAGQLDPDRFVLGVLVDGGDAVLPAQAG